MINYLIFFFNFFSWLLYSNKLFCLFVISLGLVVGILLLYIFRVYYFRVNIQDMKIRNGFATSITMLCIVGFFTSIFIYWRILRIGEALDLKIFIFKTYLLLSHKPFIFVFITLILVILVIMLLIQIILLLQKFLFYQILKIHIYLMVYGLKHSCLKMTSYEIFISKLHSIKLLPHAVENMILRILYITYIIIKKRTYQENFETFWIKLFSETNYSYYRSHLDRYLLVSSMFYDILLNNMIINKIYYILPVTFCFYLNDKFLDIAAFIERSDCIQVHAYLTKKVKARNNQFIIFEDNTNICTEDIRNINKKILLDKADDVFPFYKEHIKYKKSTFLFAILIFGAIIKTNITLIIFVFENVFYINMLLILSLMLLMQLFCWILSNYDQLFSYFYITFYTICFFILFLIFIKYSIPLLYDDVDKCFFMEVKYFYTLEEKIYFIQEYLKYKSQFMTMENKHYIYTIIKNLSFEKIITSSTTIEQLRQYIDGLLVIHEKYEDIISFMCKGE